MANYQNLLNSIAAVIRTNGNQEITGAVLQSTLQSMVSVMGANATYGGVAHPTDSPGTPDGPVVYVASEMGIYTNFGAISIDADELAMLLWNPTTGTWSKESLAYIADKTEIEQLIEDGIAAIGLAKNDALDAIDEAIEGLNIYYDIESESGTTKDIQLKDGNGNLLMPKSDAEQTTYDNDISTLTSTDVQGAIDEVVDEIYGESDFVDATDLYTTANWSLTRVNVNTETNIGTVINGSSGAYSNVLLPRGVISIKFKTTYANTIVREFSDIPDSKVKLAINDSLHFVKSLIASTTDETKFTTNSRQNRIAIQLKGSTSAATALARLTNVQYTYYDSQMPRMLKKDDVINEVGTTETDKPLSANAGTELAERIIGQISSSPTIVSDINDFNAWQNTALTRYRLWINVAGKCRITIKCPSTAHDLGLKIVGYVSASYNISTITGIKYLIFNENNTEMVFDNLDGNAVMAFYNIQRNDGAAMSQSDIDAVRGCGLSIEYYDIAHEASTYGKNAKRYGAKGDGVTDDSIALQHLLEEGGTIYIPSGTYLLNNILNVYSNTHIIMDNDTILKRNANKRFAIFSTFYSTDTTGYDGQHDIIIEGGVLDLGTGFASGGCGVGIQHASDVVVRGVHIKHVNVGYHCIDVGGSKNVKILNCTFSDHITSETSGEMVQIDGTGTWSAYPIYDYPEDSICYDGTPDINIEIAGCNFFMNDKSPAIGNHNAYRNHDIDIHDNYFDGGDKSVGTRGVIAFTLNGNGLNTTDLVYIHDNIMRDRLNGFQLQYHSSVTNDPDCGRIIIKNNILINIANLVTADSTTPTRYIMSNNEEFTEV